MVSIWNVLHNSVNKYFQATKVHCYKSVHGWSICSDQYVFVYAIYIRYLLLFNKLFQNLTSWNNKRLLYHHFYVLGIQVWLSWVPLLWSLKGIIFRYLTIYQDHYYSCLPLHTWFPDSSKPYAKSKHQSSLFLRYYP